MVPAWMMNTESASSATAGGVNAAAVELPLVAANATATAPHTAAIRINRLMFISPLR
jgi:hypothetical protein